MIKNKFDDSELTIYRKENYWRGFRACLILIVVPIVIGLIVLVNIFIKIYG